MRTTLTIDDEIAKELKARAFRAGVSFKAIVNETLYRGLHATGVREEAPAYRLQPAAMGTPRSDADVVKALALADRLEDIALATRLELRK